MGKKHEKKTAKGRLDKFYWLAKEQGFRSRAAFKLVQLNKKFNFLEGARCCIDLCAAPGGWLQVASKYMPPNSLIVGVDLVPIKPIPRCVTFAEDINSFRCRDQLRNELKDWKADIVLHDGAPNVGTAWVQDAYQQAELVLASLRLAVEFLAPGGSFVTKVFRSKDYNNLLWVFNQLFGSVEATKPPSSRNVSAEIFVVCTEYKAPKRVDPRFLDPKHVFKDLDPAALRDVDAVAAAQDGQAEGSTPFLPLKGEKGASAQINVLQPEKQRRKREGYEDGVHILYSALPARKWVEGPHAIDGLGANNEITFKDAADKELLAHEKTTEDIKACCADLKVLGKGDFRNLLRWRIAMREHLGLEAPVKKPGESTVEVVEGESKESVDSDQEIGEELERLNEERNKALRKERRKRNEARARKVLKMQLHMNTPMDIGQEITDETLQGGTEDVFDLTHRRQSLASDDSSEGESQSEEDDESENELERLDRLQGGLDAAYDAYKERVAERDAKWRAREARKANQNREEWSGFSEPAQEGQADDSEEEESEGGYDLVTRRKLKEETYNTDDEESDLEDLEHRKAVLAASNGSREPNNALKRKAKAQEQDSDDEEIETGNLITTLEKGTDRQARQSRQAAIWFDNPLFKGVNGLDFGAGDDNNDDEDEEEEEGSTQEGDDSSEEEDEGGDGDEEMDSDVEVVPRNVADEDMDDFEGEWRHGDEDQDEVKRKLIERKGLTTAEAMTLAQQLVNREKTKSDLIDMGFSKHNFAEKTADLPAWFLEDEGKHYKANVPITKEAMAALRARQRALDARPIKKIAEAKARKKFKAAQRLEKARKKADNLNDTVDVSEREKAKDIEKVLSKANKPTKKRQITTVVARGPNRGLKGRPKGVKGRYRLVDRRQKKEMRAQKRRDKKAGKKTVSSTSQKKRVPNGYGGR
ncbi:-domain-containing protein [Ceraceosorus bombacis]|uniref:-domain-containing protein n=1 Tax=Ceraceosorus bombacis TaxID=401625 RepID=A0A0P1BA20_9BASI|nr:-domain-containing protein [Ceraceosorus bombacis]